METTLLIDGGQSGCRARYDPGGETLRVRGLPRRGRDYGVLRSLSRADVGVVAAGLTGFAGEIGAGAAAVPARRGVAGRGAGPPPPRGPGGGAGGGGVRRGGGVRAGAGGGGGAGGG